MSLIIEQKVTTTTHVFDTSKIEVGDLIYAKEKDWEEGKIGFLSSITPERLTVQYHSGIGNVNNHFFIPNAEVTDGSWQIRISKDLDEILKVGE